MTIINDTCLPTCKELADILSSFGDQPLFSGNGWLSVVGFRKTPLGVQVSVKRCCKEGENAHSNRF